MPGTATNLLNVLTLAEASDSAKWSDIGGGQGSGQTDDAPRQGLEARGRRVDNSIRGFSFDNGIPVDLSAIGTHLAQWVLVAQPSKLNADAIENVISGGTLAKGTPWVGHVFPPDAYPPNGGWVRIWIDLSRTPEYSAGSINLASVRLFGVELDIGDVGGNSLNLQQDRKDYGVEGISITGGTVGSPATFQDGIDLDELDALGIIDSDKINAPVKIGGANTFFLDEVYNLKGGNQPLAAIDWKKIIIDIQQSTSEVYLNGIGFSGGIYFEILGSAGILEFGSQTIEGSGDLALNPAVKFAVSWVNSGQITWGGADMRGSSFKSSSPLLVNVGTAFTGLLEQMSFDSPGSGHAMVWNEGVPANITLSNIQFNNYGADNTANAAINYTGTSPITINPNGVTGLTVNPTSLVTVLQNQVTITFTGLVVGGEFRIYDDDGDFNDITLGTDREGVETLTQNTYDFTYPEAEGGNIIRAQFMDPLSFEEQVQKIILPIVSQNIPFNLNTEDNI